MATTQEPRPYIDPYLGGALLGLVLFASFFVTGGGLGASAALSRVQTGVLDWLAAHHVDRVAYFAELAGGARSPWAHYSVYMLAGTLLGGLVSGLVNRRVPLETRKGPRISTSPAGSSRSPAASSWRTARASPAAAPRARRSRAARCCPSAAGRSCSPSSRRLRGRVVRPPPLDLRNPWLPSTSPPSAASPTRSCSPPSASASAPSSRWPASATPASSPRSSTCAT